MPFRGSWRTTASMGSAALLGLASRTVPQWLAGEHVDVAALLTPETIQTILEVLSAVAFLIAGLVSRDNRVTSEQAIGVPAVAEAKREEVAEARADTQAAIDQATR